MGVLAHHSYPDKLERGNGVATVTVSDFMLQMQLVSQVGPSRSPTQRSRAPVRRSS